MGHFGFHHHHHHDESDPQHTHDHDTHDHNHDAEAPAGATDKEKLCALLGYMVHHNEHHAEELADLMNTLPSPAKEKMSMAIGSFEAANVQLQEVLDMLKA